MVRTGMGAGLGIMTAVLAIGVYGAYEGIAHGWSTRPDLGPSPEAGLVGAVFMTVFFGPVGGAIGAIIGGLAGLGSACARP